MQLRPPGQSFRCPECGVSYLSNHFWEWLACNLVILACFPLSVMALLSILPVNSSICQVIQFWAGFVRLVWVFVVNNGGSAS